MASLELLISLEGTTSNNKLVHSVPVAVMNYAEVCYTHTHILGHTLQHKYGPQVERSSLLLFFSIWTQWTGESWDPPHCLSHTYTCACKSTQGDRQVSFILQPLPAVCQPVSNKCHSCVPDVCQTQVDEVKSWSFSFKGFFLSHILIHPSI